MTTKTILLLALASACCAQTDERITPELNSTAPGAPTIHAFGDSITEGNGATSPTLDWVSDIASAYNWNTDNRGLGGGQAVDLQYVIHNNAIAPHDAVTLMVGTDDALNNYASPIDIFTSTWFDELVWLAIQPGPAKTTKTNITWTGSWYDSYRWNDNGFGNGRATDHAGDTATMTLTGRTIYIESDVVDGGTGQFSIVVDGVVKVPLVNCFPRAGEHVLSNYYKNNITAQISRISGLPYGPHVVTITAIAGKVMIESGMSPALINLAANQLVYAAPVPEMLDDWPNQDQLAPPYRAAELAGFLQAVEDGLPVHWVDTRACFNRNVQPNLYYDNLHPNDAGHAAIAYCYLNSYPGGK